MLDIGTYEAQMRFLIMNKQQESRVVSVLGSYMAKRIASAAAEAPLGWTQLLLAREGQRRLRQNHLPYQPPVITSGL